MKLFVQKVNNASFKGTDKKTPKKSNVLKVPLIVTSSLLLGFGAEKLVKNPSASLTQQQIETVQAKTVEMLQQTGLFEKGVRFFMANENNVKMPDKKLPKVFQNILAKFNPLVSTAKGENALFTRKLKVYQEDGVKTYNNVVILHENKLSLAAFHELGHALNRTTSNIGKIL